MSCKPLGSKLRQLHQKNSGRGFKSDQSRSSKLVYPPETLSTPRSLPEAFKDYNLYICFHHFVDLSFHNENSQLMVVVRSDMTDFYL